MRGNVENKNTNQSISDLSTKHQTSEIYLRTPHLMHVNNISEVAILVSMIRSFWCNPEPSPESFQ